MAKKKKSTKKNVKAKRTSHRAVKPKKAASKKKPVTASKTSPRKTTKKKTTKKKAAKKKPSARRTPRIESGVAARSRKATSEVQAGDLQGLSTSAGADSESVDELVEEGNAFEADVVSGVEQADNAEEQEVRTREVPEDDVPGEYLDEE